MKSNRKEVKHVKGNFQILLSVKTSILKARSTKVQIKKIIKKHNKNSKTEVGVVL